jgi:hypothetical protein
MSHHKKSEVGTCSILGTGLGVLAVLLSVVVLSFVSFGFRKYCQHLNRVQIWSSRSFLEACSPSFQEKLQEQNQKEYKTRVWIPRS